MKVAVLAGGFGTRLGELTRGVPKPMIVMAGRPFLERVVESFASRGLGEFVMLVGHHADVIEAHFADGQPFGVRIEYSRESEPLGTGGAVREARPLLGERFIVTYADVLRWFDYDRFAREHQRSCLAIYPYDSALTTIDCGNVAAEDGMVTHFRKGEPELHLPYVDAGFALLTREVLDLLPASGACSLESAVYTRLAEQRKLECEIVDRDFFDIGNPADLDRTRRALEALG